jgi:hypothetical protein
MPTGRCNYPEHHGPSAGPPFALIGLIALGAIVVAFWHLVVVVLVLAGVTCAVVALLHNHRRYYDPGLERQAALERAQELRSASYSVPAAQLPAMPAAAPGPALEAAPVVQHHLHLHGISANDAAALIARHQLPAIEED